MDVSHRLGKHSWVEILDRPLREERSRASHIFMFNKEVNLEAEGTFHCYFYVTLITNLSKGFSVSHPNSGSKPAQFWVKDASRYPQPSWCQPLHSDTKKIALPISREAFDRAASVTRTSLPPPSSFQTPSQGVL